MTKQPIWPWTFIIITALLIGYGILKIGYFVIAIPLLPLMIAAFSDAPNTPAYWPFLVLVVGYGVLLGWIVLLALAIRSVIRANAKKK